VGGNLVGHIQDVLEGLAAVVAVAFALDHGLDFFRQLKLDPRPSQRCREDIF
jgi:hypothetical protein